MAGASRTPPRRPEALKAPVPGASDIVDFHEQPLAESPSATLADEFQLFVKSVREYAIFMLDAQGHVATWNEGAARIIGCWAGEIAGQHVSRLFTAEDVDRRLPARLLATAQTEGSVEDEGWRVRADGSRFWASVLITAVRGDQGQLLGFGNVIHDLTERKRDGQAMSAAHDQESRRIAASLNDSTSPSFVALVSKLHQLRKHTDGAASQLVDDSIALAEFLFRGIRTVSYLLHPPALEMDGLVITLRSYLEGFAKHNGVLIDMDFPGQLERLPDSTETALYRFAQECLTSLLHLSGSSRARVCLTVNGGYLTLQIRDSGGRLSPETLTQARTGAGELGLAVAGMRERIKLLAGSVQVDSTSAGTTVSATVPLKELRPRSAPPY
jgi:PAS domain S-box-containing protein